MKRLRLLNWDKWILPRCGIHEFGKGSTCLYLDTPRQLPAGKTYEEWVGAVIDAYIPGIGYLKFPPRPAPKPAKPRFQPFILGTERLESVAYQGENLPQVIAVGDSEIDFNPYLTHGLGDSRERANLLKKYIYVENRQIQNFNQDAYLQEVEGLLLQHADALQKEAAALSNRLQKAEEQAQEKLQKAMDMVFPYERPLVQKMLDSIKVSSTTHIMPLENKLEPPVSPSHAAHRFVGNSSPSPSTEALQAPNILSTSSHCPIM
jgi:hypothetical protein